MGCLKKTLKLIVLILAVIGLFSLGGTDFIKQNFGNWFSPSQEKMKEKAKSVVDLSAVSEEYEIDKTVNFMGYKEVIAEHKSSDQKFAVLQPKNPNILTKNDFKTKEVDKKLEDLNKKFQ